MLVVDPARVDFCIKNVARFGLTQQDAISDRLVVYVLLDGDAVLGGSRVVGEGCSRGQEREHSVEHVPRFVNLVGLVHDLNFLIDQVQETLEGNEAIVFHDFPESGGVRNKVVAGTLPVALIPRLDHTLLHLKPQAEEFFQLWDSDGLKILGIVCIGLRLLDLLSSKICLAAQEPPEIDIEEQLEEGRCGALVVDVIWDILGTYRVT